MADIGIVKAGVRATTATQGGTEGAQKKTGPSKFDNVRTQLSDQLTQSLKLPPAKPLSDQQAASLETALRQRLTNTVAKTPSDVFSGDMQSARKQLDKLATSVNGLPDSNSQTTLRQSLSTIESEYSKSATLVNGSKSMDLQSLLKIQTQLYQMNEHVQLLSKVVDQVSSGVKTVFQTQVG